MRALALTLLAAAVPFLVVYGKSPRKTDCPGPSYHQVSPHARAIFSPGPRDPIDAVHSDGDIALSDRYQVPKRRARMRIRTTAGGEEWLQVFLGALAETHQGPERPADVFNAGRPFVVVQDDHGRTSFIRCDDVWTVSITEQVDFEEELAGADPLIGDLDSEARLAVTLEDGSGLEGRVRYQLPDANGRVLDFLNEDTAFLTLFQEEQILLVNKRRIVRVAELDKEEL